MFDDISINCECSISKIWFEHFLLSEYSQKGPKPIKSSLKEFPKYLANAISLFYQKRSSLPKYSFVLNTTNFTKVSMRLEDEIYILVVLQITPSSVFPCLDDSPLERSGSVFGASAGLRSDERSLVCSSVPLDRISSLRTKTKRR